MNQLYYTLHVGLCNVLFPSPRIIEAKKLKTLAFKGYFTFLIERAAGFSSLRQLHERIIKTLITKEKAGKGRLRHVATLLGVILCVALVPLLAVNITLIAKSFIHPEEVPDFMGYKPFIVLSGSMEPAVMTGDLVITQEVDPASLQAGDVIAYRYGDSSIITHRIREVTQKDGLRAFITKGDANNADDNVMPTEDLVEGRLRWTVPGLGNAAMFLQTPYGLLIAAGVPLLAYLLIDLLRRRRRDGHDRRESQRLQEELERMRQQLAQSAARSGTPGEGGNTNHME